MMYRYTYTQMRSEEDDWLSTTLILSLLLARPLPIGGNSWTFRSARHHDDESTVEFSESFDTQRDVGGSSRSYAEWQKKN